MSRIFCVGDIHGCPNTLEDLLTKKIGLLKTDKIVFLGDYIDRGPDSKGVVDLIMDLYKKDYDVTCLLGNHEEMFIESDNDDEIFAFWVKRCGGLKTLTSFNVASFEELNDSYKYFFKTLLHYKIINKKYIAVHAGLNFNNTDIFEDKYAMLWERNTLIDESLLLDRFIIHGHTPQKIERTLAQLNHISNNRIVNIDNGCVFRIDEELGMLTALELSTWKIYSSQNVDFI
jgi:serine/threonine protein phosphatase 1